MRLVFVVERRVSAADRLQLVVEVQHDLREREFVAQQRPILIDDRPSEWESTVFIDAGAVADKASDLTVKVGVGAGVRYRSPVGPLQLDLAYGVDKKQLRLHLSVGFTF